jgi:hypothetical protein
MSFTVENENIYLLSSIMDKEGSELSRLCSQLIKLNKEDHNIKELLNKLSLEIKYLKSNLNSKDKIQKFFVDIKKIIEWIDEDNKILYECLETVLFYIEHLDNYYLLDLIYNKIKIISHKDLQGKIMYWFITALCNSLTMEKSNSVIIEYATKFISKGAYPNFKATITSKLCTVTTNAMYIVNNYIIEVKNRLLLDENSKRNYKNIIFFLLSHDIDLNITVGGYSLYSAYNSVNLWNLLKANPDFMINYLQFKELRIKKIDEGTHKKLPLQVINLICSYIL